MNRQYGAPFGARFNMAPGYRPSPYTNKIPVQSLEDALSRSFDYDSDMACWDVNKNLIYNIYTNSRGEKQYDIFEVVPYIPPEQITNEAILKKLEMLEKQMEDINGKYNAGQNAANSNTAASTDAANTNTANT